MQSDDNGDEFLPIFSEPYSPDAAQRYSFREKIGAGAFGEVHRAIDTQRRDPRGHGGREVALKTVRGGGSAGGISKGSFRELHALRRLRHPNVLRLLDAFPQGLNLILVLEYAPSDLAEVLEQSPHPLPLAEVKAYAAMLLRGLAHIHASGLLHRDVKPSNLLISAGGVLKIADFGSVRTHSEPQTRSYSFQVATRWYRAPELLFGARRYGPAVDAWGAGVILGEMLAHRPLFPGRSDIDQIVRVFSALGTPTAESWPGAAALPDWGKIVFNDTPPAPPEWLFPGAGTAAAALASRLLSLNPDGRPRPDEALRDPWFTAPPVAAAPAELARWPRRRRQRLRPDSSSRWDGGGGGGGGSGGGVFSFGGFSFGGAGGFDSGSGFYDGGGESGGGGQSVSALDRGWEDPGTPPGKGVGDFAEHWLRRPPAPAQEDVSSGGGNAWDPGGG
ncbi:unnamed protein product [Phaeothamnion confervicola]